MAEQSLAAQSVFPTTSDADVDDDALWHAHGVGPRMAVGIPILAGVLAKGAKAAFAILGAHSRAMIWAVGGLSAAMLAGVVVWEVETSGIEAGYVPKLGSTLRYQVDNVSRPAWPLTTNGPYDRELGYALLPEFYRRLSAQGFHVESQARLSPAYISWVKHGFFPIYQEKSVHGLTILADGDETLAASAYPKIRYAEFAAVPPLVVTALLFIEDRQVLDAGQGATLNPAVSWDRMAKASIELILDKLLKARNVPGGSTLATQIEKFRHAEGGRTHSAGDKLRQMASATARAYLLGPDTKAAREQIVLDYINEVPLGAVPGIGQIAGLSQGLKAWFGADAEDVNKALLSRPNPHDHAARSAQALAFKRVLALFLSQRRPAYYLQRDQAALAQLTAKYIRRMRHDGLVSAQLAGDALAVDLGILPAQERRGDGATPSFVAQKAANAVRIELQQLLGLPSLYELDRLDADVKSTFNASLQAKVSEYLLSLQTERGAQKAGMIGERMLKPGQAARINYSMTLIERMEDRNAVRAQADTVDAPLDLNRGGKLELGSTAKLRTLITYLEMVAELHAKYAEHAGDQDWLAAQAATVHAEDEMALWALNFLATTDHEVSLAEMLDAAVGRPFSASPYQAFFTGGGQMRFNNFEADDNGAHFSVAQAFQRSNNLVFVRIMRDVVQHVIFSRIDGAGAMLADRDDSRRQDYLRRFADGESRQFLQLFYRTMAPMSPEERLEKLASLKHLTTSRWAALLLTLRPDLDYLGFRLMVLERFPTLKDKVINRYWHTLGPKILSLGDRAFVARLHPLALWMADYLRTHAAPTWTDTVRDSVAARQSAYVWLLTKAGPRRQERDLRTMLEREAFAKHILPYWQRQGFPFDHMTPSYAAALGSSGDRPAALANLMGAMFNNGVLMPTVRFDAITIGRSTPYETTFAPAWLGARRAAGPEVAATVRKLLVSVVDGGTARRLKGSIKRTDGSEIEIAAKTGTGDNRLAGVKKSRTATVVFAIGDRLYGTITAFVKADTESDTRGLEDLTFTSSLVVQALKSLMPTLKPVVLGVEDPWSMAINGP